MINRIYVFYAVWPEVTVIMAEPRIWQDIVYNTSLEIEITNQVFDPSISIVQYIWKNVSRSVAY